MKKIHLIFIFLFITPWAWAQEVVVFDGKNQLIDISSFAYFFRDTTHLLTINEISAPIFQTRFQKTTQSIPDFGVSPHPVWCRVTVKNLTGETCFLSIKNALLDTLTLYKPTESSFATIQNGAYIPATQREIPTNIFVLELSDQSAEKTFFFRIITSRNMALPMRIGIKDQIWQLLISYYWIDVLFFGLLVGLILFNLFIYFSSRNVTYLYYVISVIGTFINIFDYLGYTSIFTPALRPLFTQYVLFNTIIAIFAYILFSVSFLNTSKHTPRLHLILKVFFIIFAFLFLLDFTYFIPKYLLIRCFNFVFLAFSCVIFYAGIQVYKKKFSPAFYYALACSLMFLSVTSIVLVTLSIIPPLPILPYQLQIGTSWQMLFLSFALSERIHFLEKEKLNKQAKLLSNLQEKERIISEQNAQLEHRVRERTLELQTKQDEIIAQNEELNSQQEETMHQQKVIEETNKTLMLLNKKMTSNEAVLRKAYQKIADTQKEVAHKNEELKKYSEDLEAQIQERTQQITQTNAELVKQNSQLEQFAFITAHNLRAPVARLLGLASILDTQNPQNPDNTFVVEKMVFVAYELEAVIKDLNVILEIKKGINEIVEPLKFSEKLKKVCGILQNQITESKAIIKSDFSAIDDVQSVSPYIESIIYNLVSNAIKYRSTKRTPIISLKTTIIDDKIMLAVADNGLGMNLSEHKSKIFGLYKRFHDHVEGKGLGLYLIKTQAESLGGSVAVESTLDAGTTFYISLKR
jgi:signal transduction histidine kinase